MIVFFKQKTAYEMRISDWSSDVCSYDLVAAALPSKQDILKYVAENPGKVGKREIARAFNIGPDDRLALKKLLRELTTDGEISQGHGKRMAPKGELPAVTLVDLIRLNRDGDPVDRPVESRSEEHTSELQSLMRHPYAVFCLKQKKPNANLQK